MFFLIGITSTPLFAVKKVQPKKDAVKPNILFVLIDDMGYKDLGCYGCRLVKTPAIDKLASEGVRFTQAYACPVSSATRANLITGQNSGRHHVYEVIGCHDRPYARMKSPQLSETLPTDIKSYAQILNSQGYDCMSIGKWHATEPKKQKPQDFGFIKEPSTIKDPILKEYAEKNNVKKTGAITAKSIEFIREHKDKPFMLCVSHFLVHTPLECDKSLHDKYFARMRKTGIVDYSPTYLGMIQMVDDSVDMIMKELDNLGLAKNTIVVFYSDNGGLVNDPMCDAPVVTDLRPLRGQKGGLYEGGIRVPLIVKWPGVTKANTLCDSLVNAYDFLPTFTEMAGAKMPEGQITDGQSFVPLLKGEPDKFKSRALYWHFPTNMWTRTPSGAIRKGNYKLIENFLTGSIELYDLSQDPSEQISLTFEKPEIAKDLLYDMRAWRKRVGAELPTLNPDFDPFREVEMAKDWWKD